MTSIIANTKCGHDHKDKCFDTNRKKLSQEVQYRSSNIYVLEVMTNVRVFLKIGLMSRSKERSYIYHKVYSCEISKLQQFSNVMNKVKVFKK